VTAGDGGSTQSRSRPRGRAALFVEALGWGAAIGVAFGAMIGTGLREAPLLGAVFGALGGAINGVVLSGLILGSEIFLSRTRLGQALERAPFLLTVGLKALGYGGLIVLVVGGRLGGRLATAGAALLLSADVAAAFAQPRAPRAVMLLIIAMLAANAIFVLHLGRLVGERTVRDIVFGRYHRPRTEERFFLFVDVAGSTPLAERIGPAAVHRFLGDVFRYASDPIDTHGGEVYQYVGDEIVVTWTVAEGREGARPVACFFAIAQALAGAAPEFERQFGAVPRVRAALHGGPVITGEVGGSRRAIVYHGDVMNTTARLEQATRDLDRQFLVSADAVERLADLDAFALDDLGPQRLRGRAAPVRVYAVSARPAAGEATAG
jgi:adenylate cyclase